MQRDAVRLVGPVCQPAESQGPQRVVNRLEAQGRLDLLAPSSASPQSPCCAPALQCDAGQAAKRLKVSAAAFRWARHAGLIPVLDVSSWQWSRAAMEALDGDAIRAGLPCPPISGGAAADRLAEALGTPNPTACGEKRT